MTEQLHLFEEAGAETPPGDARAAWEGAAGGVDELLQALPRWSRGGEYLALLEFLCRFPAYSPLNAFLIRLQHPEATRVATARAWVTRFRRRLKPEAHPIAILAPMSPVVFVFDVADTVGPPLPAAEAPGGPKRSAARILDTLAANAAAERVAVVFTPQPLPPAERTLRLTPALRRSLGAEAPPARLRTLVRLPAGLPPEGRLAALAVELGHLFCGHLGGDEESGFPDRGDLPGEQADLEAESAAFLACRRLGFPDAPAQALAGLRARPEAERPPLSLNAVLQAAGRIEALARPHPPRRPRGRAGA